MAALTKVVLDTDILVDHVLTAPGKVSDLRRLAGTVFCYTTVFNAAEAFALCRTGAETRAIEASMRVLKVLGLNARSGKNIGALLASARRIPDVPLLAAALCRETRLPLVTGRPQVYRGIRGLTVLHTKRVLSTLEKD